MTPSRSSSWSRSISATAGCSATTCTGIPCATRRWTRLPAPALAHARECAREALARGDDLGLLPVERQFLYMPFEHSEAIEDQDLAVEKMRSLEAFEQTRGLTRWAERHRDVIRRFGRFPHRNAIVGRASTPGEIEFLKQPGSSF